MKKLTLIATLAIALGYLAVSLPAGAQSGPVQGKTPVLEYVLAPDGGAVAKRGTAQGYQYVEVVRSLPDGGTVAPLLDGDKRTVVATGVIVGTCLGADLTAASANGPTIPAGAEYRFCALTDLWISWAGGAAAADAPSEPLFARTCIVRGPYAAQTIPTAILGAGGIVLAGKELVACPVTRPQ